VGKKKKFDMDKIDKLLAQFPDEGEAPPKATANPAKSAKPALPAAKPDQRPVKPATEKLTKRFAPMIAWVSVGAGMILALGMTQWPYGHACGASLAIYLLAVTAVLLVGTWASIQTWNTRLAVPHILALGVVLWGIALMLFQILPRVGYANSEASWGCSAQVQTPAPAVSPVATDPVAAQDTVPATDSAAVVDSALQGDSVVPGDSIPAADTTAVTDSIAARDTIPAAIPDTSG
jgi:hypothetical protein